MPPSGRPRPSGPRGIRYEAATLDRSALYLELLPLINADQARLLDVPDLLRELRGLERRHPLGGRDRVDHRPGAHDDLANAVAGVLVKAFRRGTWVPPLAFITWPIPPLSRSPMGPTGTFSDWLQ